ncbi:hypothetical protein BLOT_005974 [Blomia tropicalis]|nr:hypothetical protein BLOT_005974 [Blomia tropicalis]
MSLPLTFMNIQPFIQVFTFIDMSFPVRNFFKLLPRFNDTTPRQQNPKKKKIFFAIFLFYNPIYQDRWDHY